MSSPGDGTEKYIRNDRQSQHGSHVAIRVSISSLIAEGIVQGLERETTAVAPLHSQIESRWR